ncbi:phosphodiesterase [Azospirillum thermophilum]|uniref:Calcineurin-like phosphoesterase domain-containing protein n=1 Tax=Azospirillum thermophilum TaxID=2202148 RepID=A0A2S2CWY3_9PROT|nr:phosphodiesterase [Azospirillum thermophilum]AWK88996.1 hypothetical protein DEW08_23490 [Azospirillum thermophilum]
MLIAQISDLHVTARGTRPFPAADTNQRLAATVAHLNAMTPRPDLVLITGDLINGPAEGEYEAVLEGLEPLEIPFRVLPGNHDDRAGLRRAFGDRGWLPMEGQFLHYAVEEFPVRVLMLDSVIPGSPVGALCPARLAWIAARLAEQPDRPTLVALHHPPFPIGMQFLDTMRCIEGAEELGAMLRRHGKVLGVVCGHIHRQATVNWGGLTGFVAPSSAYVIAFDLAPKPPYRWTEEPPAVALHLHRPDVGLVTHLSPVGDFPGKAFK